MLLFSVFQIVSSIHFGGAGSTTPIHWGNTQCSGTETRLVNCTQGSTTGCGHDADVGVICSQPTPGWVNVCIVIVSDAVDV